MKSVSRSQVKCLFLILLLSISILNHDHETDGYVKVKVEYIQNETESGRCYTAVNRQVPPLLLSRPFA